MNEVNNITPIPMKKAFKPSNSFKPQNQTIIKPTQPKSVPNPIKSSSHQVKKTKSTNLKDSKDSKGGKATKVKKDPNLPKRASSSYIFFAASIRAGI
jgi:hypothetical protein